MIRFYVTIPGAIGGDNDFETLEQANDYAKALKLQGFKPLVEAREPECEIEIIPTETERAA